MEGLLILGQQLHQDGKQVRILGQLLALTQACLGCPQCIPNLLDSPWNSPSLSLGLYSALEILAFP